MFEIGFNFSIGRKSKKQAPQEATDHAPQVQEPETPEPIELDGGPMTEEERADVILELLKKEDEFYKEINAPIVGGAEDFAAQIPAMPRNIRPGRSSVYEGRRNFSGFSDNPVATNFPFDLLKYVQQLGVWNRHVSFAVENTVTLGNTEYTIEFDEGVSESDAKRMRNHLRTSIEGWYEFSEGSNSLINDLLAQLALNGCVSAEAVIKNDLSGIKKVVRVDPVNIRFSYDENKDEHIPLQEVGLIRGKDVKRTMSGGYVKLNTNTYCYVAMRRFGELPYAIPPYFSAIEDILIENDMVKNFANMMRRLGMLGFLSVLIGMPKKRDGESQQQYERRTLQYLEEIRPGVEKGFHKGVAIGYKDKHDFKVAGNDINAGGGNDLLKMVKSLIFSGLKQDPNMHGENQSTTETFGRVIFAKTTRQMANFQGSVASFLSFLFKLELSLQGFAFENVKVKFEPAAISDKKHIEETEKLRLENSQTMYNQGLIGQDEYGERHNIQNPDLPGPRQTQGQNSGSGDEVSSPAIEDETGQNQIVRVSESGLSKLISRIRRYNYEYLYEIPRECKGESFVEVTAFKEPEMLAFVEKYVGDINIIYSEALEKAKKPIEEALTLLPEDPSESLVINATLTGLLISWDSFFITPMSASVEKNLDSIYDFYRKDERPFVEADGFSAVPGKSQKVFNKTKGRFFDIPEPVFDLLDVRALEFLESMDILWLGKFITDQDTQRRITQFITNEVIGESLSIGNKGQAIERFTEKFINFVSLERWKIRRIVETTANRARNTGNVLYMNQAKVQSYEVVEVADQLTCPWCLHMHGKVFQIAPTVEKIQELAAQDFENLPQIAPFATSTPIDQFTKFSAVELQSMGYDVPSYHPHCRGRVVANL